MTHKTNKTNYYCKSEYWFESMMVVVDVSIDFWNQGCFTFVAYVFHI